jgi:hypothetical protein
MGLGPCTFPGLHRGKEVVVYPAFRRSAHCRRTCHRACCRRSSCRGAWTHRCLHTRSTGEWVNESGSCERERDWQRERRRSVQRGELRGTNGGVHMLQHEPDLCSVRRCTSVTTLMATGRICRFATDTREATLKEPRGLEGHKLHGTQEWCGRHVHSKVGGVCAHRWPRCTQ